MRKRVKRKHYALVDPIAHAICGAAITDKASLDKLRLGELAALDAMTRGMGTVQEWRTLVDMMNVSEVMGLSGIGPEVLPFIQVAQEELHKAAKRYEKTLKMGLSGVGIKALRDIHEYHDLQRLSISRSEYERMIDKTKNRIMSGAAEVVHV
jgi:hypothetical protein